MPRFPFPLALLAAGLLFTTARADDTPGEEAIKEAITILEARKAQVEKKEDKDKIDRAIADLGKLLPGAAKKDGDKAKAEPDLAKLITPALLKKKFAGKAAFNPKTGELTLVYDFANKDQLKDFDLGDAKPKFQRGVVELASGESVTHVVEFKTLRATGVMSVKTLNQSGPVSTTGGIKLWFKRDGMERHLKLGDDNVAEFKGGVNDLKGAVAFDLTVAASRCSVKVGGTSLGKEAKLTAGGLTLGGGTGGAAFGKLTLTGTVSEEWAREFFKE